MRRVGGLLPLLLIGLGLFAAVYLLFGEGMTGGLAGSARDGSQGAETPSFLAASAAELEAKGTTRVRKSAAEKAADDAKKSAAERLALKPVGVHGLVLDGRGQPIPKATVKLLANPPHRRYRQGVPDGPALDTTITNDKGEFIVGPSPENGYAKVRAEAPGYAPTIQPVRTRGARADLILDRGGALKIKLLDAQGKRVAGAEVIHQAGTVVTAVTTSDDGMAHFAALPTGTGSLVVTKPGYGAVRDGNVAVAPGETEERTLILPDAIEVEGTVVDAETQRPLAGATVTVRYQNLPSLEDAPEQEVATTDEEGRFKITLSVSGRENTLVRASLEGFAEGRLWRNAQARGELQFKLVPAGEAIEGTVLSEDRQPLKGVRLTFQGQQQEDPAQVPETTSGEDGSFVLRLPPWAGPGSRWNVVAVSQEAGIGYARASVPAKGKGPAKPIEITLAGVGTVKGVVTDGAGAPLPGAVVSLAPDWAATQNRPGRKRQPRQLLNIVNDGTLFNLSTVSGTDGSYAFTGVPAMDYKLSASLGLDSTTAEEAVELSSDETAEADIKLGEGLTIEGWILDPEDKPIPGAYVNAQPKQRTGYGWWMNRASARSQSDGKFVLRGVTDKEYTVSANASGFGGANEQNVTGGDKELRLVLKARGWIVGVVRSDGRPYRGMFTVSAQRRSQGDNNSNRMMNSFNRGGQQTRTFNTDDGRFEMKGLGAGEYRVTAKTSDGLISLQADVVNVVEGRGSREARIELTTGAVVTGQLRDDETGRGMPSMWVYANPKPNPDGSPAPNAYSQTDAQGRFELKGLGTATYTISVWVSGTTVSKEVELATGGRSQVELVKRAPGMVTFMVSDEDGNTVAGARPNLRTASGQWIGVDMGRLRREGLIEPGTDWRAVYNTNDGGRVTRYHVPPGVVKVWVTCNGYTASQQTDIEVNSGGTTEVSVTLKRAGR